jgi:hypothetical protein
MHGMNITKINVWSFISASAHIFIVRKCRDKLQVLQLPGRYEKQTFSDISKKITSINFYFYVLILKTMFPESSNVI